MRFGVAVQLVMVACTHGVPPADPRCADGAPLFQGDDQRGDHVIRAWISTVGAWAYSESGRSIERGCLDAAQLAEVRGAIARATWMPQRSACTVGCVPGPGGARKYYVNDQLVFVAEDCGTSPDDATATAIADIFTTVSLARK